MKYFISRNVAKRAKSLTSSALALLMIFQALGPGIFAVKDAFAVAVAGTIEICKITLDAEGNSIAIPAGTTFTVPGLTAQEASLSDAADADWDLYDAVFDSSSNTTKQIGNYTAVCESQTATSSGNYYYGEEEISSSLQWEEPRYNDSGSDAFYEYDDSLLTGAKSAFDTSRQQKADGHIKFTSGTRMLIVVNQLKDVPEIPENSCALPDTNGGTPAPFIFGESTDDGKPSLQSILDGASYSIDTVNDETAIESWTIPTNTVSIDISATYVGALSNNKNTHVFGYYVNGDVSTFTPIFQASTTDIGDSTSVTIPTIGVTSIGFGIFTKKGIKANSTTTITYVTESSENFDSEDHAVVYNPKDNTYVIGFEDLQFVPGDQDYQDLIVEVVVEKCNEAVCKPGENLIQNGGFEKPEVKHSALWETFTNGFTGLDWSVAWMNESNIASPALELHKGVNGWNSASSTQHAELDADTEGPNGSQNGEDASVKIWQDVPTIPGKTYKLSYDFSPRPGTDADENVLGVWFGGIDHSLPGVDGSSNQNTVWTNHFFFETATTTTTRISFADLGISNSQGTFLDNVSLVCEDAPVPQCRPGTVSSGDGKTKVVNITTDDDFTDSYGDTNEYVVTLDEPVFSGGTNWDATTPDANAKWIWSEDPANQTNVDKWVTFKRTFTVVGTPSNGLLHIATDNSYEVWVNGVPGTDAPDFVDSGENNHSSADVHSVTSLLHSGENTLTIRVKNWALGSEDANPNNPGGLLYTLSWECEGGDQEPNGHTLTIEKFINTKSIADFEGDESFNIGTDIAGAGATHALSSSTPSAIVNDDVSNGKTFAVDEDPGNNSKVVLSRDACTTADQFYLAGYSVGTTRDAAIAAGPSNDGSNTISGTVDADTYVIVWNEQCPEPDTFSISGNKTEIVGDSSSNGEGWTIQLFKKVETLEVDATESVATTSLTILEDGKTYLVRASGTYTFDNAKVREADAAYSTVNGTWDDAGNPHGTKLDLWVDGVAPDWGAYNTSHIYTMLLSGASSTVDFRIEDAPYSDNDGSLTVEIYELVATDVTDGDGNYSFDNLDAGEYLVQEVDQNDWTQVGPNDRTTDYCEFTFTTGNSIGSCDFVNEKDSGGNGPVGGGSGTLVVKKVIVGGSATTTDFSFSIEGGSPIFFEADGDNSFATSADTYTIEEVNIMSGYTPSYDGDCDSSGVVTVVDGQTATCTITNTYNSSQITTFGGGGNGGFALRAATPSDEPTIGEVAGASIALPGMPNAGNGAGASASMIAFALILSLGLVNFVGFRTLRS